MRRGKFIFIFLISISSFSFSKNSYDFFINANQFFKKYVKEGKVDYKTILQNPIGLNSLVQEIAEIEIKGTEEKTKKAFYINAYNILLIKNVIDHYPLISSLETKGFFSKTKFIVSRDSLTLNEIEEKKLIAQFKDVRIFFALSSATIGSVSVADFAYMPDKLDQQFEKRIKSIANNFAFVRVMNKSSLILIEESFKKSQKFFFAELIDILNKHRENPLPASYTIDFYPGSRKLNIGM